MAIPLSCPVDLIKLFYWINWDLFLSCHVALQVFDLHLFSIIYLMFHTTTSVGVEWYSPLPARSKGKVSQGLHNTQLNAIFDCWASECFNYAISSHIQTYFLSYSTTMTYEAGMKLRDRAWQLSAFLSWLFENIAYWGRWYKSKPW